MKTIEERLDSLEAQMDAAANITKKRKKQMANGYLSFSTGCPEHDDKMFNKANGTDFPKETEAKPASPEAVIPEAGTNPAPAAADVGGLAGTAGGASAGGESAGGGDAGAGEGGAMGESLTEETKRYVKRYYIRPQNVFCSNKTEILQALVDLDDEDCTIYSLKSLGDHDDVQLLKPADIIYYYEDGIIYDKNHVKVMDYDLSPKHEEERKKYANIDQVTDREFSQEYDNRMTDMTADDTIKVSGGGKVATEGLDLKESSWVIAEKTCEDGYFAECAWEKGEGIVVIGGWKHEDDGLVHTDLKRRFRSEDEAMGYYKELCAKHDKIEVSNPFNEEWDSYTAYGNKLTEDKGEACCICGEELFGYGNNAEPYKKGRCCDACNIKFVIPARLKSADFGAEEEE